MLSVRPKITDLNFHLFGRNVHPELFEVCASRTIERANYQLEISITTDGHLISFRCGDILLSEISASSHHPLPSQRILISQPIEGKSSAELLYQESVAYQSQVEIEGVHPKTFVTIQQQLSEKIECEGLIHRFQSNGRIAFGAVSYINVQAFRKHVKLRTFHTFPDTNAVIKSESSFTLNLD